MATPNQYTTEKSLTQGQSAENVFYGLALSKGYRVKIANPHQERIEHWDLLLEKDGSPSLKVEIKSQKNFGILHGGQMIRDYLLVEFAGISGHKGWIYGKSDLIVYELKDSFLLVGREYLLSLACEKCSAEWVDKREKMLYKNYGRRDRLDQVSAILILDLQDKTKFCFWRKD